MKAARGQVIVLACGLLCLVAFSLLATINVGRAVHDRIRLQNAADAAAYSSAALEARAFNFYAYANRTQVSHYTSAMVLHSLLSFLFFAEAWLTDADGMLRTLAPCGAGAADEFWAVACPLLQTFPATAPVMAFLQGALALVDVLVATYQQVLRASDVDAVVGRKVIPALLDLNAALAGTSTEVMLGALGAVERSSLEIAAMNDPRASVDELGRAAAALSTCLFDRAHVRETGGSPLAPRRPGFLDPTARREADRVARGKRAMAQAANAARPDFALARPLHGLVPRWLAPLQAALQSQPKWGQTRLLTHGLAKGWDDPEGGNYIREPVDTPDAPSSMLAQGDDLGADDPYQLRIGPARLGPFRNPLSCGPEDDPLECWGEPRIGRRADRPFRFSMKPSVWALNPQEARGSQGGIHWRVAHEGGHPAGSGWRPPSARNPVARALGLNEVRRSVAPGLHATVFVANVRPIEDGNHPWRGVASFPHFEPGQFPEACGSAEGRGREARADRAATRERDFNQPSTFVSLSSPALSPAGGRMRAVARAQAYYHRPGNWAEAPSFFNPYWRARLAPVWQGRDGAPSLEALWMDLPAPLADFPQKVLVH
jgi:hypothetical protein